MAYEPADNIVVVQTNGPIDRHTMPAMLEASVEFSRQHHCHRILGDHRGSELKMDVLDTFNSPRSLFNSRADLRNRAALVYSTLSEIHKLMETVFLNQGRTVACFTDLVAARKWLVTSGTHAP